MMCANFLLNLFLCSYFIIFPLIEEKLNVDLLRIVSHARVYDRDADL